MNGLDWLILGIVVLSALVAALRGFVFELFSLAGTIAGYLLAAWEYPVVARRLAPYVKSELIADGVAFLLIFIAVLALAGVAGRIARWATKNVGLRLVDRALGALFGILRGALIVMVLVMAMASFLPSSQALAASRFAPYFLAVGRAAIYAGPGDLKQRFREGIKALEKVHPGHTPGAKGDGIV
jgi:membrane protein required for colicin V production